MRIRWLDEADGILVQMMDEGYCHLQLEVRVDEIEGVRTPQLIPRVNGSILALDLDTRAVRGDYGRGMDPDLLLGRRSPLMPPDVGLELFDERPQAPVWRGSRVEDVVSISLRVYRENAGWGPPHDAVLWTDWNIRHWQGLVAPGPLRFNPSQYYSELIRADVDRRWEDVPRRVARHVTSVLDDRPEILGRWGFGLISGRGYVAHDEGTVEIGVSSPHSRYYLTFSCDPHSSADTEASRTLDKLTETHPDQLPATIRSSVI